MYGLFNALSCRSGKRSIFEIGVFSNQMFNLAVGCVLAGQFMVIYIPFFYSYFQTVPLSATDWWTILWVASLALWVEEVRKMIKGQGMLGQVRWSWIRRWFSFNVHSYTIVRQQEV
jgi:Ca2+-transporting ATPase